jgi:hypothetical protein
MYGATPAMTKSAQPPEGRADKPISVRARGGNQMMVKWLATLVAVLVAALAWPVPAAAARVEGTGGIGRGAAPK